MLIPRSRGFPLSQSPKYFHNYGQIYVSAVAFPHGMRGHNPSSFGFYARPRYVSALLRGEKLAKP